MWKILPQNPIQTGIRVRFFFHEFSLQKQWSRILYHHKTHKRAYMDKEGGGFIRHSAILDFDL